MHNNHNASEDLDIREILALYKKSLLPKWYQSLSTEQQNERLENKRKMSKEQYQLTENAEHKKMRARQTYRLSENAKKKKKKT